MIYHCTRIENYNYIKNNGLISERNYFLEYDNDLNNYEDGEPGIACVLNYKDVIDRLYPDPEWASFDIIQKTGNPNKFYEKNIDERVIYCLWITDILKLDITKELSINDITDEKMDFMVEENMFQDIKKTNPELFEVTLDSFDSLFEKYVRFADRFYVHYDFYNGDQAVEETLDADLNDKDNPAIKLYFSFLNFLRTVSYEMNETSPRRFILEKIIEIGSNTNIFQLNIKDAIVKQILTKYKDELEELF